MNRNDTEKALEEKLCALEEENRQLKDTLDQREKFIRATFGRYLSQEVLEEIMRQEGHTVQGESRVVTMMFTDLRDSTFLSEHMRSEDFVRMLNHYYSEMIKFVNAWQGNILEFVGDAIVAVFGAPHENKEAAKDSIACAVAMQRCMKKVNEWNQQEGYPDLSMGIGIHTGWAILGTIGSDVRAKYDMIGRNVNLAARIQSYAAGGQILISDDTLRAAGSAVILNPAGSRLIHPKGILNEVTVHDVIGYGSKQLPDRM